MKPYLYLLPLLVFAGAFSYYPFLRTVFYSVSRVNFRGEITGFAGLRHYRRLFGDPVFAAALGNTLRLAVSFVPLNLAAALGLALLSERKRGRAGAVYESMFMAPMAVSMTAASEIFKLLLDPALGIVNHWLGIDALWFTDPRTALNGILLVCLWVGVPLDFLLLLAALRRLPRAVLEAAVLDGAGPLRRILWIKIPLTAPTIFYVICTNLVLAMMTSTPVMIITGGGPERATTTLVFLMYTAGYQSSNYSLAACVSVVTFGICLGMTALALVFEQRRVHYG